MAAKNIGKYTAKIVSDSNLQKLVCGHCCVFWRSFSHNINDTLQKICNPMQVIE